MICLVYYNASVPFCFSAVECDCIVGIAITEERATEFIAASYAPCTPSSDAFATESHSTLPPPIQSKQVHILNSLSSGSYS